MSRAAALCRRSIATPNESIAARVDTKGLHFIRPCTVVDSLDIMNLFHDEHKRVLVHALSEAGCVGCSKIAPPLLLTCG